MENNIAFKDLFSRKTTNSEVKYLKTTQLNKRKITRVILYAFVTAFVLQAVFILASIYHDGAFGGYDSSVASFVLLIIFGALIYLFQKSLKNDYNYQTSFRFEGPYTVKEIDDEPESISQKKEHYIGPYLVEFPEHWLDLNYLKVGHKYTCEGCPIGYSYLGLDEDELEIDFGGINVYDTELEGGREAEDSDWESEEIELELDEEDNEVKAIDFVYSILKVNQKLSIDRELQFERQGYKWTLKNSFVNIVFFIGLIIVLFFDGIEIGKLMTWATQGIDGVKHKEKFQSVSDFVTSKPAIWQKFTINNSCIISEDYYDDYLIDDIDEFEKNIKALKTDFSFRQEEIKQLSTAILFKANDLKYWENFKYIGNLTEFLELKKKMLLEGNKLNISSSDRANDIIKRFMRGMIDKEEAFSKIYQEEADFRNKEMKELLKKNSSIDIRVNTSENNYLPSFSNYDIKLGNTQRELLKLDTIVNNCRKTGSVSGFIHDYGYYSGRVEYIDFDGLKEGADRRVQYYKLKPYIELSILLFVLLGFMVTTFKRLLLKKHNKSVSEEFRTFYQL